MINLFPENRQRELKKHFLFRVFVFVSGMVCSVLVMYLALASSSFFYLKIEQKALLNEKESLDIQSASKNYQELLKTVSDINYKIDFVDNFYKNRFSWNFVLSDILDIKNEKVKFDKIHIMSNSNKNITIQIEGTAMSREDLAFFIQDIRSSEPKSVKESNYHFLSVDLPIINFAESTDVSFSMTISYGQR